jgi:hypothetical protein
MQRSERQASYTHPSLFGPISRDSGPAFGQMFLSGTDRVDGNLSDTASQKVIRKDYIVVNPLRNLRFV